MPALMLASAPLPVPLRRLPARDVARPPDVVSCFAEAIEAQTQALATHLHDRVLQELYGLHLAAPGLAPDALHGHLERIAAQVESTVRALQPPSLLAYGLLETLRSDARGASGVRMHVQACEAAQTPHPSDLGLYRIVQEALANVAQHAGVEEVWLTLARRGAHRVLRIRDEGSGFAGGLAYRRWSSEGRYGLTRARLYARALGGRLQVRSAPGAGTRLEVRVPTLSPLALC